MIPKPGQGFITGLDIQFVAVPYPLPEEFAAALTKAGAAACSARKAFELCKDGEASKLRGAEAKYKQAVVDLDTTTEFIRNAAGVVHTRPSFLSVDGAKKHDYS